MYLDELFKENLIKDFREQMRNVVDDHEPGTIINRTLETLEEKKGGGFDIAGRELLRAYREGFAPLFKRFNPEVAAVLETIRYADLHISAKGLISEKMIERHPVQSLEALLRIDERTTSERLSTLKTETDIFLKDIHQVPQTEIAAFTKEYRNKEAISVPERLAFLFDHSDTREKTLEILAAALTEGVCFDVYRDQMVPYDNDYRYLREQDIYEMSHIKLEMPDKLDTSEKVLEASLCLRIGKERSEYNHETVFSSKEKIQMLNDIADSPFTKGNKLKENLLEEVVDKILDVRYGGNLEDKMSLINDLYLSNFGEKKSAEKSSILFELVKEKPQYASIVEVSDYLSEVFAPKAIESALDGEVKLELVKEKHSYYKFEILGVRLGEEEFKEGFVKIKDVDKKIVADFIEKPKTGTYGDYFKANLLERKEGEIFGRILDDRVATTAELQYIALALGYIPAAEPANEELSYIIKGIEQLERNDNGDLKVALDIRLSSLRQSYIELTGDSSNKLEENYNKYERIASEIAKGVSEIDEHSLAFYLSTEAPNSVMADKLSAATVEIMDRHGKEDEKTESNDAPERQDDKNDNLESDKDNNGDDAE